MFALSFSGIVRSSKTLEELSMLNGVIAATNFKSLDDLAGSAESSFGIYINESLAELEEQAKSDKWATRRLTERNREITRAKWIVENLPIYQPRSIGLEPPIASIWGLIAPNSFFSDEEMKEMRLN